MLDVRRPGLMPVTGGGANAVRDDGRVAKEGRVAVGGSGRGSAGGFASGTDDIRLDAGAAVCAWA